ncbi:MAG: sulfite exporter TauE/SafE family protein [Pirellulales bacterium]
MWILLSAVATASLLGSLHCVGMCGPLAIWAAGAEREHRSSGIWLSSMLYHFGRGLTYAIAGLIAGGLGQLVDLGGSVVGVQLLAGRIVGGLMIVFGLVSLSRLVLPRLKKYLHNRPTTTATSSPSHPTVYEAPKPNWMTAQLLRLRPILFKLPLPFRGLSVGLLTALLPCGWLYLFALLAAGTGSVWTGGLVMIAFWTGSVPLLVGLVAGTRLLGVRMGRVVPWVASLLLVAAGAYTATGRGFANLSHELKVSSVLLEQLQHGEVASIDAKTLQEGMKQLVDTPLPCCPNCLKAHEANVMAELTGTTSQDANQLLSTGTVDGGAHEVETHEVSGEVQQ